VYRTLYTDCLGRHFTSDLLFIYFILPAFLWVCLIRVATLIFGAELGAWPLFSFIFDSIYEFKEAKAPVTAARNTASVLQRHNASVSSVFPSGCHPVVSSSTVWTQTKNTHTNTQFTGPY
jgi:hypothetical protein